MRHPSQALRLIVLLAGVLAIASFAFAQDGSAANTGSSAADVAPTAIAAAAGGFTGGFFVSRVTHPDGSQTLDLVGSVILWLLMAMSVFNLGLMVHLAIANKKAAFLPPPSIDAIKRLVAGNRFREALDVAAADQSFFCRILHPALAEAGQGYHAMMRVLEQKADVLATQRMRPIEILYMFGQVSPMIGLLGTVYGIIFAFSVFVSMGGRASPALLAGGIGTALVATFWGLVVAIPALAGYSLLRNKVDQLTLQSTVQAEEIIGQLKTRSAASSAKSSAPSTAPAQQRAGAVPA